MELQLFVAIARAVQRTGFVDREHVIVRAVKPHGTEQHDHEADIHRTTPDGHRGARLGHRLACDGGGLLAGGGVGVELASSSVLRSLLALLPKK